MYFCLNYLVVIFVRFSKDLRGCFLLCGVFALAYNLNGVVDLKGRWRSGSYFFSNILYNLLAVLTKLEVNLLFLFVVLALLVNYSLRVKNKFLVLIFFYVFWNNAFSLQVRSLFRHNPKINSALLNGLLEIHPILLLWFFLLFFLVIWRYSYFNFIRYLDFQIKFCKKITYDRFYLLVSLFALITGGWWAQQELNWGGWWVWDAIEVISLVLFICLLGYSHTFNNKSNLYVRAQIIAMLQVMLICYFYTRYGLIPSIHNFLSDPTQLQYDYILFFLAFLLVAYCTYCFFWYSYESRGGSIESYFLKNTNLSAVILSTAQLFILFLLTSFIFSFNSRVNLGIIVLIKYLTILTLLVLATRALLGSNLFNWACLGFYNFVDILAFRLIVGLHTLWGAGSTQHKSVILFLVVTLFTSFKFNSVFLSLDLNSTYTNYLKDIGYPGQYFLVKYDFFLNFFLLHRQGGHYGPYYLGLFDLNSFSLKTAPTPSVDYFSKKISIRLDLYASTFGKCLTKINKNITFSIFYGALKCLYVCFFWLLCYYVYFLKKIDKIFL